MKAGFSAVAAILLGAGAAQAQAQTLTLTEARSLPAPEIARRVLGAAGALYPELQRPGADAGLSLPGGPHRGLTFLTFAGTPRSAGFSGLCQADIAFVSFRPIRAPTQSDVDPPARVSGLSTSRWYRIVGDAETPSDDETADRDERRLERICARSGPVLGTADRRRFFSGEAFGSSDFGPWHASFAARALQHAIRLAASGAVRPACMPNPSFSPDELCGDPVRQVARLAASAVFRVVLERCSAAGDALCVTVSFLMPDRTLPWSTRFLELRIETDAASADRPPARLNVRQVSLSGTHIAV
ncbi:MAG TPA: hypothetical protein VGB08_02675 [Allosphingosinicella sp.]|jgi:hypothetical protein